MITLKDAIKALDKKWPGLTVVDAIDYDEKYYVLTAVENPKEVDYNDPYYAVDKKTGDVYSFDPTSDLPKFARASYEKKLKLPK